MIGDGINDSPALVAVDVGMTIETDADIILTKNDLQDVMTAIHLSRKICARIRLNYIWALGYNLLTISISTIVLFPSTRFRLLPWIAKSEGISSAFGFSRLGSVFIRLNHTMATASKTSVHDFTVEDARGNDVDLSIYKGKVLLIVNVASQCGLTNSNYTELAQLYAKYKDQGFEILAFPCNQFGSQEPGTNEEIVQFACTRFKAEYPIFNKVDVNGKNATPLYKYLKSSKGGIFGDGIKWNFSKFLVNKDGKVVDRYAPTTSPLSIEKDVKKLLVAA
ncbi:putative phospholipid hydroperoxide glutathione peroxidase 6, mitochondrial, partial [Cucurbita argyrosperma subsp. sororia]